MQQLCPFEDIDGRLQPTDSADHIASNRLVEERTVEYPEDASRPLLLRIYAVELTPGPVVVSVTEAKLVTRTTAEVTIEPELMTAVRARVDALPNDWHEVFPSDHNLNEGFHFPDPWGEPTTLLRQLADALNPVPPPVNHNKVSSRRVDCYALDEIHIDSFEGMRVTAGRRTLVWRYFINLGEAVRWTAVVPFDPAIVDRLLAIDYHANYLDPVLRAAGWCVPIVLVPTPPRTQGRAHALKLCSTHLLHSEHGDRGDLLAVINSLA